MFCHNNDSEQIQLSLYRQNLVAVKFELIYHKGRQELLHCAGSAELLPSFFLAEGLDMDDSDNSEYGTDEYYAEDMRYDYGLNTGITSNGQTVARFSAHAKDTATNKSFDNLPTLHLHL